MYFSGGMESRTCSIRILVSPMEVRESGVSGWEFFVQDINGDGNPSAEQENSTVAPS